MERLKRVLLLGKSEEAGAEEAAGYVRDYLQEKGFVAEWINTTSEDGKRKLTEEILGQAELIVTFDLVGFERSTQSGSFLYNIIPVKSVHFVGPETETVRERLQKRKISIALFFVFLGITEAQYKEIEKELPELPWMQLCQTCREEIEKVLSDILEEISL